MLKINGYNEDLPGAGGEDDDLEWRFNEMGIVTRNIKFITPNYHLYHPDQSHNTELVQAVSRENKNNKQYYSLNDIVKTTVKLTNKLPAFPLAFHLTV